MTTDELLFDLIHFFVTNCDTVESFNSLDILFHFYSKILAQFV